MVHTSSQAVGRMKESVTVSCEGTLANGFRICNYKVARAKIKDFTESSVMSIYGCLLYLDDTSRPTKRAMICHSGVISCCGQC